MVSATTMSTPGIVIKRLAPSSASEDAGVERIGLDLRMGDDAHLLWIRDHNFLT
jgi:hypothetical protein